MVSGARVSQRRTAYEDRETEFYWLWIIATSAYGVGDVVTTIALFYYHPLVAEANPLLDWAMSTSGVAALVGIKISVFLAFIAISLAMARRGTDPLLYYAPPAVLAVLGTSLTVYNIVLMVRVG